jgi:hypothetical protein
VRGYPHCNLANLRHAPAAVSVRRKHGDFPGSR